MVHVIDERRDEGAIAIVMALLAISFFVLAALVVDLGIARDSRRQAQNAADAASLAAAVALYPTTGSTAQFSDAVDAAKAYALDNYGVTAAEWSSCVASAPLSYVPTGVGTNCISFDDATEPSNVLVVIPLRQQPVFFGGVVGYQGATVGALAQAKVAPGDVPVCSFCLLRNMTHTLSGTLSVTGGDMRINGSLQLIPPGRVIVNPSGGVGGTLYLSGNVRGNRLNADGGTYVRPAPQVTDPLATRPLPFAAQSQLSRHTNPCRDGPGVYGDFQRQDRRCTLRPGLYVFTGAFEIAGDTRARLNAVGVTMFFTCGSASLPRACGGGQAGGSLDVSGLGGYSLAAPTATSNPTLPAELYGFSVVYDRNNTAPLRLTGNGSSAVRGTIYAKGATFETGGNGCSGATSAMVLAGDLRFSSSGACFATRYDPNTNAAAGVYEINLVR